MPTPNAREIELAAQWYVRPELLALYRAEVLEPIEKLAAHYEVVGARADYTRKTDTGLLELVAEVLRERMVKDGP